MREKILFDGTIFDAQRYGGISRYIFELAKSINALAASRALIVAPLHRNEYLRSMSLPNGGPRLAAGKFHSPDRRFGRLRSISNRLLTQAAIDFFRPDYFHKTYYTGRWPNVHGARRIITVYDMIYELFPDQFKHDMDLCRAKEEDVRSADAVICISECTKRDLLKAYAVDPKIVKVVYLGCNPLPKSEGGFDYGGKPYILFVGSRGGYKNFSGLLEAWSSAPHLRREYDLLCFGGGDFTQEEERMIAKLGGARSSVRNVQGDDGLLRSAYEHAALFVYPSLYEGFGIPPLEAMHCGCPVLCSDSSSIPEVVGDAGFYFSASSEQDLALKLNSALSDTASRKRLIAAGAERVKAFTWEKCAEQTLAAYGEK